MSSSVRGASSARQSPDKWSQVGAEIGSSDNEVGDFEVGKLGQDVVESDKRARCRGAVIVPDVAVVWILSD